jgi:hypothetical protein
LIFPIPAITAKLNPTKIVKILKIDHQLSISPENTNFWPKSTNAVSGHKTTKKLAKSKLNTAKYV